MDKTALYSLSYGVYALGVLNGLKPTGCIVNTVVQVASTPTYISVSVNHDNFTCEMIKQRGWFTVSVLGEKAPPSLFTLLGFTSGRNTDKSEAFSLENSFPVAKEGTIAVLVARVKQTYDVGTHTMFVAEVEQAWKTWDDAAAMTYAYYHSVLRMQASKNAPTYIAPQEAPTLGEAARYVCQVCGWQYDGDVPFEDLSDDFVCPACGAPKSRFAKQ